MLETAERCQVGPYLLTKPLAENGFADRYLALHQVDQSSHVAYRFHVPPAPGPGDWEGRRVLEAALAACRALRQEHLLAVEDVCEDDQGALWAITPFTGDVDGLRTLSKLLREKSGQMHPSEAERAIVQLLEPIAHAHGGQHIGGGVAVRPRVVHGPLTMDEVLVDRHGRLFIEMYGLVRALEMREETVSAAAEAELMRDEVRSVVEIGYQLITGLRAEAPVIPAGRLVKKLDPRLDRWLARGLDVRGGYATAAQALAELPGNDGADLEEIEIAGGWGGWAASLGNIGGAIDGVRDVLSRLRSARG